MDRAEFERAMAQLSVEQQKQQKQQQQKQQQQQLLGAAAVANVDVAQVVELLSFDFPDVTVPQLAALADALEKDHTQMFSQR